MHAIAKIFRRPLVSDPFAAQVAQIGCYVAAIAVFVFSLIALTRLAQSQIEIYFGLLLTLILVISMICAGTLVRIEAEVRRRNQ